MKNFAILVSLLVLTVFLMTGCGCRNSKPLDTMPSESTSMPTTVPTTAATTAPTTEATILPTMDVTEETVDNGNGPMPTEGTWQTEETTGNGITDKSRQIPGRK